MHPMGLELVTTILPTVVTTRCDLRHAKCLQQTWGEMSLIKWKVKDRR